MVPSHYLNQYWLNISCTPGNTFCIISIKKQICVFCKEKHVKMLFPPMAVIIQASRCCKHQSSLWQHQICCEWDSVSRSMFLTHYLLNSFNSLSPGKFEWNFGYLILQIISVIDGWVISCELALRWMSLDLTDDKSTLVQVMAWCHQATSHYLSQGWPRSLSPYGNTSPNELTHWLLGDATVIISKSHEGYKE